MAQIKKINVKKDVTYTSELYFVRYGYRKCTLSSKYYTILMALTQLILGCHTIGLPT